MTAKRERPAARRAAAARATPRRWLPFVLLVMVVVAAAVVSGQVRDDEPVTTVGRFPGALLPVAAPDGAVSSTWYCAGGTAVGESGPFELTAVIANAADHGVDADVTVVGPKQTKSVRRVAIPARGRTRVVAHDVLPGDWAAMTVDVLGGAASVEREVSGPDGFDVAPCSSRASASWYVPSGSTLRGTTEQLVLYNPFPSPTSVDIRFVSEAGKLAPRATQGIPVGAHSIRVITVENPSRRRDVAAWVTTRTGLVVVDRLQRSDGSGDEVTGASADAVTTAAPRGIVSTPAIPTVASHWVFPEVRRFDGGRLEVALFNPGTTTAVFDLTIGYENPDRFPQPEAIEVRLRPGRETLVDLTDNADAVAGVGLSLDLQRTSGPPVAAEVRMTNGTPPAPSSDAVAEEPPEGSADEGTAEVSPADVTGPGLAVAQGSPVAAKRWSLPLGGRSRDRVVAVTVLNPGARPAKVTVTEVVDGRRRTVPRSGVTVAAGERRTLVLTEAAFDAPLVVHADQGVVVGRLITVTEGRGLAVSLALPFPSTVVTLP